MVIFVTFRVLALDGSTTSVLFAGKTFALESFVVDIFYSFDTDHTIFLLKVALGNPNRTNIMNPNVMANWNISRVCGLDEVIIIAVLLFFTPLPYHFHLWCFFIFAPLPFLSFSFSLILLFFLSLTLLHYFLLLTAFFFSLFFFLLLHYRSLLSLRFRFYLFLLLNFIYFWCFNLFFLLF